MQKLDRKLKLKFLINRFDKVKLIVYCTLSINFAKLLTKKRNIDNK